MNQPMARGTPYKSKLLRDRAIAGLLISFGVSTLAMWGVNTSVINARNLERGLPPVPTSVLLSNFVMIAAVSGVALVLGIVLLRRAKLGLRRLRSPVERACPVCGYSRTGLPENTSCPECGSA